MKLTVQQIVQIDKALVLKGMEYVDIKLELIDHIASEIEEKMTVQEIPFEVVLNEVFENWKGQLRPSYFPGFGFGLKNSFPRIIFDKYFRKMEQLQLKVFLIALLPTLFFAFFLNVNYDKFDYTLLIQIFKIMGLTILVLIIVLKFLIFKSKIKTSFSLYFNRSLQAFYIYFLFNGFGFSPIKLGIWDYWTSVFLIMLLCLLFIYSIFCLKFAYQHLQFIKQLKLS